MMRRRMAGFMNQRKKDTHRPGHNFSLVEETRHIEDVQHCVEYTPFIARKWKYG